MATCLPLLTGGGFCPTCESTCGGCCLGSLCILGLTQAECGRGAEACHACTGGDQCVANGTGGACVMPEAGACGPSNCPGCCEGNVCAMGNQVIACGTGGAECINCGIYGETCPCQ